MENIIYKCVIDLPPRTKKNSQQILVNPKTNRPFVMPSKLYKEYENACYRHLIKVEKAFDFPINIKLTYYMPTRRKVDLSNLISATSDILVKYKIISDDNRNVIVSYDGSRVYYDKENPRTIIEISKVEDYEQW